jgi:hypothetical protein
MVSAIGIPVLGSSGRPYRWNAACRVVPSNSPISAQVWPACRASCTASRIPSSSTWASERITPIACRGSRAGPAGTPSTAARAALISRASTGGSASRVRVKLTLT